MAWVFTAARRVTKRRHSQEADEILARLRAYLDDNSAEPVDLLCGFWRDQQDAITYQEMRVLIEQGYVDEITARLWQQDYSVLVNEHMPKIWGGAMVAGARNLPLLESLSSAFTFNMQTPGVLRWIQSRGAEMVTVSTQRQKDAIALLLEDKMRNAHTVDELARLIRPCVGLYRQQAAAVTNYYDTMVKALTEQHPRTAPARIQAQALDKSVKYAERLHRQRALTIAQTEMAFAYNYGADEGVRQAQADFLIGRCEKVWSTSGDDRVCDKCAALDNKRIGMEERFYSGNTRYEESGLYPPLHPRCACAVQYVEVEAPHYRQTGGSTDPHERSVDEMLRRDDDAEAYYSTVRERTDDVEAIATNIGRSREEVEQVKNHVFIQEHKLDDGVKRFDASYDMSIAWQRMINGEQEERDLTLFDHELLESQVERVYNLTYREAHAIAHKKYPWNDIIVDMFGGYGEDADLHDIMARERK